MLTPLTKAIEEDQFDLAKKIIEENKNDIINQPDDEGNYPLHLVTNFSLYEKPTSSEKKQLNEIATLLLEKRAKPNVKDEMGSCPIHYAALYGDLALFEKLISCGADYNAGDLADETPLHQVIRTGRNGLLDFLLEKSDLIFQKTKVDNLSPIDYAKKFNPSDSSLLLRLQFKEILVVKYSKIKEATSLKERPLQCIMGYLGQELSTKPGGRSTAEKMRLWRHVLTEEIDSEKIQFKTSLSDIVKKFDDTALPFFR